MEVHYAAQCYDYIPSIFHGYYIRLVKRPKPIF